MDKNKIWKRGKEEGSRQKLRDVKNVIKMNNVWEKNLYSIKNERKKSNSHLPKSHLLSVLQMDI